MLNRILNYISLRGQIENFDSIHESILQSVKFKGMNFWILICAIIIASIGLNTNSTAVIIGAMLISPLMGPINGMGYSIAVYDASLFKQSIRNFAFAVIGSLVASSIYFAVTPVSTAHSELLARISPTIYDVLIALFGGFAGIVAISAKQKGNVIPGVAIATALMPPLCTAGYGIGTGQFSFFWGAFYLFTINTVCIAYATIVASKILKFPIHNANLKDEKKKSVNRIIIIVLAITILPSIYLGYQLTQEEKFKKNAQQYIQNVSIYKGNYLLNKEVSAHNKKITLVYGGSSLTDNDKDSIQMHAEQYALKDANIDIKQGLSIDLNSIEHEYQNQETMMRQEIARLNRKVGEYEAQMELGRQLLVELQPLFPLINSCTHSKTMDHSWENDSSIVVKNVDIVTFTTQQAIPVTDQSKIKNWLERRLDSKDVNTYFEIVVN